ncbi:MAG TPA: transferrin receptor-like dimerization domain-containing protein, partial [Terriglobales bacterium]|nr:transferrin receptor-like dimerization domain-containing protein [Terriglobales bacterium]
PAEWVMGGNHRDAGVFGAVDPNSGTAAMLETVHGIGSLLKSGWKPKRTLVFASWDGEEEGLVGSTEYVEQYSKDLDKAVAYFNIDAGVSGPNFGASAVPSLKQFVRDVTKAVPSPKGGTLYDTWKTQADTARRAAAQNPDVQGPAPRRMPAADSTSEVPVGDLGSGSDYTGFLQHLGVPSTDVATGGPYGVYHSAFDNFAWFKKFGDPTFVYEQEMARVMGLQMLRMSQADVLPFDYEQYGKEISNFLVTAQRRSDAAGWAHEADFAPALEAAQKLQAAGKALQQFQQTVPQDPAALNAALVRAEREMLTEGLPNRPFFRHSIFAPGEFTGYAAVVIPGVNEAIDQKNLSRLREQLKQLTDAVQRASVLLGSIR